MQFGIKLTIYFKIENAEVFGEPGSVGYSSIGVDIAQIDYDTVNIFNKKELMEEYISEKKRAMAEFCKVSAEYVHVISKEEYDANVDEDEN